MNKCKIVIIDSGIDRKRDCFSHLSIEGEGLVNGKWEKDAVEDDIGHGTAVTYIIGKEAPFAEFYILKLFQEGRATEPEELIGALTKCMNEIKPDIIHMSNGMTSFDSYQELEAIINKLVNNTVIVAAFDNAGWLSLPAAFEQVIGVDYSLECLNKKEFIHLKNNKVDFLGMGRTQRLPWKNGGYKNVKGASFAAPHITAEIAKIIAETGEKRVEHLKNQLGKISKQEKYFQAIEKPINIPKINKAIVFPFNKEIHGIARFEHLITAEIKGYYDDKLFGNVGKKVSQLINCQSNDEIVHDYSTIDWNEDFDSVILGHLDEMENLTNKNYIKHFVEQAYEYGKQIISFDSIEDDDLKEKPGLLAYTPSYASKNLEQTLGKMYQINTPVLGIYGTGSKQGKFSLQLKLRERLMSKGYQVGQLGTEPSSLLFGMDEVFPIGYNSTVNLKNEEVILAVNQLLKRIEDKKPDLIMFGMQSNTIPYNTGNISFYNFFIPLIQLGALPDACLLCINSFDDMDYIMQTIQFIESYTETKVISLIVSPVSQTLQTKEFFITKFENNKQQQLSMKNLLSQTTDIPVFLLDDEHEIDLIIERIESFFS